jgi:hypothetical protein
MMHPASVSALSLDHSQGSPRRRRAPNVRAALAPRRFRAFLASAKSRPARAQGPLERRRDGQSIGGASPAIAPRANRRDVRLGVRRGRGRPPRARHYRDRASNRSRREGEPTLKALAKLCPNTPVTRTMGEFEVPLSNRKAREVLGFKEAHDWRTHVSGCIRRCAELSDFRGVFILPRELLLSEAWGFRDPGPTLT